MEVEWLILADAAQVVGNKLYLMGGGWDRLTVDKFPKDHAMGIAMSIRVPWNQTNERHSFGIEITSEDGETIQKAEGSFEIGRPPGIQAGQDQRMQFAISAIMHLGGPGTFVVIASIDEEEKQRVTFTTVGMEQSVNV